MNNRIKLLRNLLKNQKWDEIYDYFGRQIYSIVTPISYKRLDIKRLMEEKRYGQIYNKYGFIERLFIKNLAVSMKNDIKMLLKKGDYEAIYQKYGSDTYNKYLPRMMQKDIELETGSKFKAKLYKGKFKFCKGLEVVLSGLVICSMSLPTIYFELNQYKVELYSENTKKYAVEIEEYNQNIEEYASHINELNLTDIQVIMKVIDDTWNDICGYGEPKLDILGYSRLDFKDPNGIGVCRNLADDFTAKMNAINPDYNARNIVVYLETDEYKKEDLANIDTKIVPSDSVDSNNESDNGFDITKLCGNHMVTILTPLGKDYQIIVDPTNPSIGVITNGKIYMLQTENNKGLKYVPVGEFFSDFNDDISKINNDLLTSILDFDTKKHLDDVVNEFGLQAQNDALEYVRNLDSFNMNSIR